MKPKRTCTERWRRRAREGRLTILLYYCDFVRALENGTEKEERGVRT